MFRADLIRGQRAKQYDMPAKKKRLHLCPEACVILPRTNKQASATEFLENPIVWNRLTDLRPTAIFTRSHNAPLR